MVRGEKKKWFRFKIWLVKEIMYPPLQHFKTDLVSTCWLLGMKGLPVQGVGLHLI